jgi:hypothetical protein
VSQLASDTSGFRDIWGHQGLLGDICNVCRFGGGSWEAGVTAEQPAMHRAESTQGSSVSVRNEPQMGLVARITNNLIDNNNI